MAEAALNKGAGGGPSGWMGGENEGGEGRGVTKESTGRIRRAWEGAKRVRLSKNLRPKEARNLIGSQGCKI